MTCCYCDFCLLAARLSINLSLAVPTDVLLSLFSITPAFVVFVFDCAMEEDGGILILLNPSIKEVGSKSLTTT